MHTTDWTARIRALGYTDEDMGRIGVLRSLQDVPSILDRYDYDATWRQQYHVRSVRSALWRASLNCFDAAMLAYGLLDFLSGVERWILAIHRRSPDGEECGHVATVYRTEAGFGAFSKSNYKGLGHREPRFASAEAVACSFAAAYVRMGFTPLFFGITRLEDVAQDLDWRGSKHDLNVLTDRLVSRYAHAFDVAGTGVPGGPS